MLRRWRNPPPGHHSNFPRPVVPPAGSAQEQPASPSRLFRYLGL